MFVRKFVTAIAVSSALVLGTTGCSLTHNVTSMLQYTPSDGTDVTIDGVKALNLIYLTPAAGTTTQDAGAIIGSFVNDTTEPVQIRIQFTEDGAPDPAVIAPQQYEWTSASIAPGAKFDLGYNDNPALAAVLLNASEQLVRPGDLVKIGIAINSASGQQVDIPALDGSLEQYKPMVQSLTNSATPTE